MKHIKMDLKRVIKRRRAKQNQKQPFKRNVFNKISCIVKQYDLRENFLDLLDNVEADLFKEKLKLTRVRIKTPLESSLFSLATKHEYDLTQSIINKINNAYLKYAHSPAEILLSAPLYQLNPSLSPKKLERYHFETLFLHELAKKENMRA